MNGGCCGTNPNPPGTDHGADTRPPLRFGLGLAGWVIPGAILALMPKCPMCLAAYLALGTGLAVSPAVAAPLRISLIALSVGWLCHLGTRRIRSAPRTILPATRRAAG